jgi:hypothetical protein
MANVDQLLEGVASSLYLEGWDVNPELLGKKVKSIGEKIVSKIKKIKRKGGVQVSTPGGSVSVNPSAPVVSDLPPETLFDKLKKPEGIAIAAGAAIVLYMVTKKKRR